MLAIPHLPRPIHGPFPHSPATHRPLYPPPMSGLSPRIPILIALALVLAAPFLVRALASDPSSRRTAASATSADARRLVVVTPHVEQIQMEFAAAFDRWHQREFKQPVVIDYRQPGGTSDIIKQLEASFAAAARKGLLRPDGSFPPGTAGYDLFFGGGSFEHSKMREMKSAPAPNGTPSQFRMGRPAGFPQAQLDEWFGDNKIGTQTLYDPEQYWIGVALSGFGIVYNRDVLKRLGLPEPTSFRDLCDPKYVGNLAMTDGRQSGSVTTTYESILNKEGWDGWRTLRELAANARYFASAATKAPIDVGQGEAAAGLSIDFYGRGQAQFLAKPGEPESASRVGYVDPAGAVYIDADPVSMLNGAMDEELAKRFIAFCLTEEAQALWQFPARTDPRSADNPKGSDGTAMGPERYELRRMPVRRVMYQKYTGVMIDKADPFAAASDVPGRGWRSAIGVMMAAFGIDTRSELVPAWMALNRARAASASGGFPKETLARMEHLFYAMPTHTFRPGSLYADPGTLKPLGKAALGEVTRRKITTFDDLARRMPEIAADAKLAAEAKTELETLLKSRPSNAAAPAQAVLSPETFRAIRADTDSWRDPLHGRRTLIDYTAQFRANYLSVVELERNPSAAVTPAEPRS